MSKLRIGYSSAGMQGADLYEFCRDIAGVEIVRAGSQEELDKLALSCDALMLNSPRYTPGLAEILKSGRSPVRWLQFASVGYETAEQNGTPPHIVVTNGQGVWGPTVAEHAAAMILGLFRALPIAERERLKARWDSRHILPALRSLEKASVGIFGFGDIGQGLAARLRPFGAEIVAFVRTDRSHDLADLVCTIDRASEILPKLDVVVLALPLTPDTEHMVNAGWLKAMKPGAILINVGRGRLVDEDALVQALSVGKLGGAGLDVAHDEPLSPDSPLWSMSNVIITPHIAAMGGQALMRLLKLCRENVLRFQNGKDLVNQVMGPSHIA